VAVGFLEQIQLLDAAVDVVANVVPRIRRVVLVRVGPGVGQEHLPGRTQVGKGVEYMGDLAGGKVSGVVVAAVDAPVCIPC